MRSTQVHTSGRRTFRIIDDLNAEWQHLEAGGQALVSGWVDRHPVLTGCRDLGDVLRRIPHAPDRVLCTLLTEASESSGQMAGRVVLQAMLGKCVRMAAQDRQSSIDEYVGALWCRIYEYPVAARPQKVAANLALDTLKSVTEGRRWNHRADVMPLPVDDYFESLCTSVASRSRLDHSIGSDLTAQQVIAAALQLGLIKTAVADILTAVYDDGLTGRESAERHNVSETTVRFHCSKAVRRLAAHAELLADAA